MAFVAATVASAILVLKTWSAAFHLGPREVSTAVGREARDKRASTVDFAELARFSWTDMLTFGPYTSREDMCRAVSLTGLRCWWIVPAGLDESYYFLVFREGSRIVHYEHHARRNGDLSGAGHPRPLRHCDAVFRVLRIDMNDRGKPWIDLQHQGRAGAPNR